MALIINDLAARVSYTVSATPENTFGIPFPFAATTDIVAIKTVGTQDTPLTLGVDYTVSGAGQTQGGQLLTATPLTNCRLTILRSVPIERTTDFPTVGPFPIEALNEQLDKLVMMVQQVRELGHRAIRTRDGDPFPGMVLPAPEERANKLLAFGPAGELGVTSDALGSVVARAEGAVAQATQIRDALTTHIARVEMMVQQAQAEGLLPVASVLDAGKPIVVTGDNSFGVGAHKADQTLANVSNADFAAKADAAGVGSGGTGSPLYTHALLGGSF